MSSIERSQGPSPEDWRKTGEYLRQGLFEVSIKIGGDELVDEVIKKADSTGPIPNAKSLQYLEELCPGSAEEVMSRADQIQRIRHKSDKRKRDSFISRLFRRF